LVDGLVNVGLHHLFSIRIAFFTTRLSFRRKGDHPLWRNGGKTSIPLWDGGERRLGWTGIRPYIEIPPSFLFKGAQDELGCQDVKDYGDRALLSTERETTGSGKLVSIRQLYTNPTRQPNAGGVYLAAAPCAIYSGALGEADSADYIHHQGILT